MQQRDVGRKRLKKRKLFTKQRPDSSDLKWRSLHEAGLRPSARSDARERISGLDLFDLGKPGGVIRLHTCTDRIELHFRFDRIAFQTVGLGTSGQHSIIFLLNPLSGT